MRLCCRRTAGAARAVRLPSACGLHRCGIVGAAERARCTRAGIGERPCPCREPSVSQSRRYPRGVDRAESREGRAVRYREQSDGPPEGWSHSLSLRTWPLPSISRPRRYLRGRGHDKDRLRSNANSASRFNAGVSSSLPHKSARSDHLGDHGLYLRLSKRAQGLRAHITERPCV